MNYSIYSTLGINTNLELMCGFNQLTSWAEQHYYFNKKKKRKKMKRKKKWCIKDKLSNYFIISSCHFLYGFVWQV